MPNLIEIQKNSYQWFLEKGLKEVLNEMSEITDYSEKLKLRFLDFRLDENPKYSVMECKERDTTYAAPMRVRAQLLNEETGEIKESEVFIGDFPLMTDSGTFVINGAERVIVSQLVRSPGVYYNREIDKSGRSLFNSTVIPNRGAWLEYETDQAEVLFVRIDKNRKILLSTFVRALGMFVSVAKSPESFKFTDKDAKMIEKIQQLVANSVFLQDDAAFAEMTNEQMRQLFGVDERFGYTLEKDATQNADDALLEVYKKLRPGEPFTIEGAITHIYNLFFDPHRYDLSRVGRYKYNKKLGIASRIEGKKLAQPVINPFTGEIIADAGETVNAAQAAAMQAAGVYCAYIMIGDTEETEREFKVVTNGMVDVKGFVNENVYDAVKEIVNENVSVKCLADVLESVSDDEALIEALTDNVNDLIPNHITFDDMFASINYFLGLNHAVGVIDDIDHLGNRRIRSVGELLQNQFRIGFARMERVIREKMTLQAQDLDTMTPQTLINIRPVVAAIKEFFGSSPLSQFMDQTNPLSELTHKRRLSALGPGGLSRDRAGFEVRDVHYSHYGRMCPIETPEGPNIGLISYLATYARINKYGFVETPFRKVDKATGVVLDEVVYMTADEEDNYIVAQANETLDENGRFKNKSVTVRFRDQFLEVSPERVDFMDVSPKMVVSVATAMIPFLENDDTNRALMGSNMQKQAVPLLKTENPIVATGMEYQAAVDSGVVVLAKHSGEVISVSADTIEIRSEDGEIDTYKLIKFLRSNHGTCVNQRPIVNVGEKVCAGDVIADGPATSNGEISLGKNALIGFMTWEGYNYEDAVLLNEQLIRNDVYTSIHIEKYEIEARDTKLGPEEITRDIPNVGEDALKDLDERGIIRIGAEVRAGDILVGKVTPKGETELTAEERLLRAIFGEKAREVRDTSLRVPHGEYGTIVDVDVFTRENSSELNPGVSMVVRCYIAQKRKISVGDKMAGRHGNKGVVSRILPVEDMPFLPDGRPLDIVLNPLGVPSRMNIGQVLEVHLGRAAKALGWKVCTPVFDGAHESDIFDAFIDAGVYRDVKFNEIDRKLGENLDGKILVTEEIDENGKKQVFTLDKEDRTNIEKLTELAEKKILKVVDGKTWLYDGRTGEMFDNPVTVGYMYYLKLHHLVDDKIHARSTGPYSLVTQQPLGGKAQFGGQRFGEMEVWALEAYGAAYTLQEILTVKSDDIVGRVKAYEAIVKGQNIPKPGVPESFKVLIKELQSLGLDIRVLDKYNEEIDLKQTFEDDEADMGINAVDASEAFEEDTVNDGLDGFGLEDENGEPIADETDDVEDIFDDEDME
ncbi:MAG: DNA-directed RNA polymerase subunit beta [Clostridia bacterium]|nr:DNA-directed RNA polymerase subunit beta [Clostridia bacterium]